MWAHSYLFVKVRQVLCKGSIWREQGEQRREGSDTPSMTESSSVCCPGASRDDARKYPSVFLLLCLILSSETSSQVAQTDVTYWLESQCLWKCKATCVKIQCWSYCQKNPSSEVHQLSNMQYHSLLKPSLHTIDLNYAPFTGFLQQNSSNSPCTRLQQLHCVYGNVSCLWGIGKQRHLMKVLQQPWKSSTFVCFRSHYTIFFISFSFASGIHSLKNDLLFLQYLPCF